MHEDTGSAHVAGLRTPRKPRSPVTMPGFRQGLPAANKGMNLKAEILSRDEVARLMDVIPASGTAGIRNRAMVALMYRAEVKIGILVQLAVRQYDRDAGCLSVPTRGRGPERVVKLDSDARKMLEDWLDRRADLRVRATAPLFCTVASQEHGRPLYTAYLRDFLAKRGRAAGIQKRVTAEGLRQSRRHHRLDEVSRFESTIAAYVNADAFRRAYPEAHQKWSDAHHLLETAPDRYASTIGHLCREAVIEFSDELVGIRGLGPFESVKTKAKLKAVFATEQTLSPTIRRSLEALVDYWETVADLVSRQVHASSLAAEDSRRLVFQTMVVMREVDLALQRLGDISEAAA